MTIDMSTGKDETACHAVLDRVESQGRLHIVSTV